jgi:membrane protease YdiL (CAAX protease family)
MTAGAAYAAAVFLLVAINLAGIWLPGWSYVPLHAAAGAGLLAVARRGGADADDLGLSRKHLRGGLLLGGLLAGAAGLAIVIGTAVPATHQWFEDDRAAGIGIAGLLYQVLLRIPVGTAIFEEIAFRGVLVGLGRRLWTPRSGTTVAALLFGIWHITPSLSLADANATASGMPVAWVVVLAVLGTTTVGWVLTYLRDRSGSLATPILLHVATNSVAFAAAWVILR